MTIINAAFADEGVIFSPLFGDQFDYQTQNPAGPTTPPTTRG